MKTKLAFALALTLALGCKPSSTSLPRTRRRRLTLRSSRTPPALPSALRQYFAISAPLIVSVQAVPLSFIR